MPILMNLTFGTNNSLANIEVDSFHFGMVALTTENQGAGAGSGKVMFHEIRITKHLDQSSPKLLISCTTGKTLPSVQLVFEENRSKSKYLVYELTDVLISSIHMSSGGENPTESVSLAFEKFEVTYADPKSGGVIVEAVDTGGRFFYPTE